MTPAEVLAQICKEDFKSFINKAFRIIEPANPFENNWHIDCIAEHLQAQFEGDETVRKLIINLPPRCLKSVLVAQIYPAWMLINEPHHQIIGSAYAHSLAEKNVTKCRQILQSDFVKAMYDVEISPDNNRKDYFTTTQNGQYKGTGIGGTITGYGCSTLLIDDPLNPKEGMSDTIRMTTNDEVRSTLFSRWNNYKEGRLALIMQRLHEGDTSGELLSDGGYYHLKLPAYTPKRIQIDLHGLQWVMNEGDYLTPRLDKDALDELEKTLGTYHFSGQYMQEPVPLGGGEFKEEWVQFYSPHHMNFKNMNVVILCDPAGGEELNKKKKKLSDWSAFVVVGLAPDNNYYVLDIIRDRLNPTERVDTLFMLHRKWNGICGKPPKVGYEKYGMMTDTHYIRQKMEKEGYNFGLVELGGQTSKEERIRWLIPDMQMSRWYFPHNMMYVDHQERTFDLVQEFIKSEMLNFPKAKNDDMMDALSRVYDPELHMHFPKAALTMTQRAMPQDTGSEDWLNW